MSLSKLKPEIADRETYDRAVRHLRENRVRLPTFAELAEPRRIADGVTESLASVDADAADPANLYRVHWYNGRDRGSVTDVPGYLVLPTALTGVEAPIVVVLGERFPMIRTHKVLAAYACLAPRLITGRFDPTRQRAVWPSTGNYCRGGVAISRILGTRGVAVLPEGMSAERFRWLESWVSHAEDIVRTPGTESNVKEIYDACRELERDPENVVLNQFSEYPNYVVHYVCTGPALARVMETVCAPHSGRRLWAFVCASGSAGTLGAGDYLKERHGTRIVAVEALECPTLLYNGYGEHNIQGIGDKHVPLIHNVMNTDLVVGVSDRATDGLNVLFNTDVGRDHLARRLGVDQGLVDALGSLGLSSICNVLAAIKVAKAQRLSRDDALVTIATDGAELYGSELEKARTRDFADGFDEVAAAETCGRYLLGAAGDHVLELTEVDRRRIFNLGYFTWVEQQGVSVEDFDARRDPGFWRRLRDLVPAWDGMIEEFNAQTGLGSNA